MDDKALNDILSKMSKREVLQLLGIPESLLKRFSEIRYENGELLAKYKMPKRKNETWGRIFGSKGE
jgi:hypothetical protein